MPSARLFEPVVQENATIAKLDRPKGPARIRIRPGPNRTLKAGKHQQIDLTKLFLSPVTASSAQFSPSARAGPVWKRQRQAGARCRGFRKWTSIRSSSTTTARWPPTRASLSTLRRPRNALCADGHPPLSPASGEQWADARRHGNRDSPGGGKNPAGIRTRAIGADAPVPIHGPSSS